MKSSCISPQETLALYDLYHTTDGDQWKWKNEEIYGSKWNFSQSLEDIDPCHDVYGGPWQGLICCGNTTTTPPLICPGDNNIDVSEPTPPACHILEISLVDYGLKGALPSSICNFNSLQSLSLGRNFLVGTVPNCWISARELTHLSLPNNHLNGSLPESLSNLSKLHDLILSSNSLTGHIFSHLSTLSWLQNLVLAENQLSGSLPDEFYRLTALEDIDLNHNHFTGTLSEHLGSLVQSQVLSAVGNSLSGSLPSSLGKLSRLSVLRLARNLFTNTIPSEIGLITSLVDFSVTDCKLIGSVPSEIGSLTNLRSLSLRNNSLSKRLPSSLAQLSKLKLLVLDNNRLTGSIPSEFGVLTSLDHLYLQFNELHGPINSFLWQASNLSLSNVDLSYNLFSHHIPDELFVIPQLQRLYLSSNCLHGTLPASICRSSSTISALYMNALGASQKCPRTYELPGSNVILGKAIGGTIPRCVWDFEKLTIFQFSGNVVGGTLSELNSLTPLVSLQLSHNKLSGTIPRSYQQRKFLELDLSYNKLSGDCSNFLGMNASVASKAAENITISKMKLNLIVNRLSGEISTHISDGRSVKILEGNMFTCGDMESATSDPYYHQYSCGSSEYDLSLYSSITAISAIVFFLFFFFTGVFHWKKSINSSSRSVSHTSDDNESLPSLFNPLFSLWNYITFSSNFVEGENHIAGYLSFCYTSALYFTIFISIGLILFIPFYVLKASSTNYTSHEHLYSWYFTVAYSIGLIPGLLLCAIWSALLCLAMYIFHLGHIYRSYVDKKNATEQVADVRQKRPKSRPILMESNSRLISAIRSSLYSFSSSTPPTVSSSFTISIPWILYSGALFLINVLVIFGVHGFYVYLLYRGEYRTESQLMLTFFNLIWNNSVIPAFIQISGQDLPYYVFLRTWVSIWNLVITPVLVTSVIDTQCLQVIHCFSSRSPPELFAGSLRASRFHPTSRSQLSLRDCESKYYLLRNQ